MMRAEHERSAAMAEDKNRLKSVKPRKRRKAAKGKAAKAVPVPVEWQDTPLSRAKFVSRRMMAGLTLQEVMREAPSIDPVEFFMTLESDPEAMAYFERAMHYAGHWLAQEQRDLPRLLYQKRDVSMADIRKTALLAESSRWLAKSVNPKWYSDRPQPAAAAQIVIRTSLNMPGTEPDSRFSIENAESPYLIEVPDAQALPAPSEAVQSVLDTEDRAAVRGPERRW